jgi:MFS family permease
MYHENLGFVIGVQEAVTGLGYMVGPCLGAALYSLGGFKLPFIVLGVCPLAVLVMLPPLLRDAHNFEPNHQLEYGSLPMCEDEVNPGGETKAESGSEESPPTLGQVLTLPFVYVALGTTLATCGFAFVEPVLSEHLMKQLGVSTSISGLLMGVPSIAYIVAAPFGGWLGEVCGYRPVIFAGFVIFAVALALIGPVPAAALELSKPVMWAVEVTALVLLGLGSAFGSITTLPDMKYTAGPGTTDLVAGLFNNVFVPAGEVSHIS